MPKASTPFDVELDNGEAFSVNVDQRDWAALEAQDIPENASHTRTRFLAYSATRRAGKTAATWDDFNTRECVEASVAGADEDESEDEQGLDPGNSPTSGIR